MNNILKHIIPAAALVLGTMGITSCTGDLHVQPIDPNLQTEIQPEQLFNKCYANFGTSGNGGANGDCDVDGIDGGTSGLYRQYWNANELPTDEAICGWGDQGIAEFCNNTYDASHPMLRGYYYRLCVGIAYCNQYLGQFADHDATMTAEVRFLRAFQYYLLMDAFGNIPFTTVVSSDNPPQASRAEMYSWLEGELKNIIGEGEDNSAVLADPSVKTKGQTGYGRIDKAAAWMLLSRLYLNAEVYTGTAQWANAATYAKKVIDSPYKLYTGGNDTWSSYQQLFMGDNGKNGAQVEDVFPIIQDGQRTTSWGVALYLIASTYDADMHSNPNDPSAVNGVSGRAWGGNRARPQLVRKFFPLDDAPEGESYQVAAAAGDDRALFNTVGRQLNVENVSKFKEGFAVAKFTNFTTDGSATSDATFPDMDVMMMRVAEAYLTYAEALTRQAGGTAPAEALAALNALRTRAHASTFPSANLTNIADEWSREFYFEGLRRTTLIRFGQYGGNTSYTWQWKGGAYDGRSFASFRNIFAIPSSDITVNKNLVQNPGY